LHLGRTAIEEHISFHVTIKPDFIDINIIKTVAIDTPGGKHNLKMKIKAQEMTFRQDITKI
jgi:hypothetical protein